MRDVVTIAVGIIVVLGLILMSAGFALADDETTLIKKCNDVKHGGMTSVNWGAGSFAGETRYMEGWQSQWVINHSFGIGLYNYSLGDFDKLRLTRNGGTYDVTYETFGLDFECFKEYESVVHPIMGLSLGGGFVKSVQQDGLDDEVEGFYMAAPRVGVEVNVVKWMRITGTASYRFGMGLDSRLYDNSDISGYSLMFGVKFGSF